MLNGYLSHVGHSQVSLDVLRNEVSLIAASLVYLIPALRHVAGCICSKQCSVTSSELDSDAHGTSEQLSCSVARALVSAAEKIRQTRPSLRRLSCELTRILAAN